MKKEFLSSENPKIRYAATKRLVFDTLAAEPENVSWNCFADVKNDALIFRCLGEVAPAYVYRSAEYPVFDNFIKLMETRPSGCEEEAVQAIMKFADGCHVSEYPRLKTLMQPIAESNLGLFLAKGLPYVATEAVRDVISEKLELLEGRNQDLDDCFLCGLRNSQLRLLHIDLISLYAPHMCLLGIGRLISYLAEPHRLERFRNYYPVEKVLLKLIKTHAVCGKLAFTPLAMAIFNQNNFDAVWKVQMLEHALAADIGESELKEIKERLPKWKGLEVEKTDGAIHKLRWTLFLRGIRRLMKRHHELYPQVPELLDRCAGFDVDHWIYGLWLTKKGYQDLSLPRQQCLTLQLQLAERELKEKEPRIDAGVYLLAMLVKQFSRKRRRLCQLLLDKMKNAKLDCRRISLINLAPYLGQVYTPAMKEDCEFLLQQVLRQNHETLLEDMLAMDIIYDIRSFCQKNGLNPQGLAAYEETFRKEEAEAEEVAKILAELELPALSY